MASKRLDFLLKQLALLSPDERNEVRKRLDFLQGNGTKVTSSTTPITSILVGPLLVYAKRYVSVPHVSVIYKGDHFKSLESLKCSCSSIEELAKKLALDRKQTHSLCKLVIDAGAIHVTEVLHWDLSFHTLMLAIADPHSLIEESLPGYLKAGWLIQILE